MRNGLLRGALLAATVVALGAWADRASASAFQLVEQNGSGLGNAFAGQAAAAEDASTVFWNPAGMAFLPGGNVSAAVSLVRPTTKFEDGGTQPSPLPGTTVGGNGGDAGGLNVVPNGYVSWEVWKNLAWAGVGVSVPFGLKTEWDDGWVGRFHALKSEVKTININPSAAFKVNEWLAIGAGANVQWLEAELSNAVNYSAIVAGAAAPAAGAVLPILAAPGVCAGATAGGLNCEGVGTVKGDSWSWGWNAGVMLNVPVTSTRVGVSYRSAIEHDVEGDVSFTNVPAFPAATPPALSGAITAALAPVDVATTIELPDTASVAVAQQLGRMQLLADFTWTGWSKLQDLTINRTSGPLAGTANRQLTTTPLRFDDSWRVGVGANYQLFDALKVRGGVAYDESPVKDEFRTPRLPDQDRFWVATGAQWAFSKRGAVDLGFAWLFVKEASTELPSPPPPTQAPRGTLRGTYGDTDVWIASAQAKYSF